MTNNDRLPILKVQDIDGNHRIQENVTEILAFG